ncbi:ABC transporter ATP-binding protein [Egicoccus halophilus]|uniref:ABC transporter ATP-binding protein n=1 Tax=Egicoccus halophilus TaxID=1670830 RepID=UPI001030F245
MLTVQNLEVVYEDVILVLKGVSIDVPKGSIVALLGANGAGKTTVLRAITGLLDIHRGEVTKGSITFDGEAIHRLDAPSTVAAGIGQVMEGRRAFAEFTVEENLRIGAHTADRGSVNAGLDRVFTLFPRLAERRRQMAGYLSGGEQQMLVIGRALMADPKLLLLDEPSLGLAPLIVQQIRDLIVDINRQGTSVLLVEQNANMALSIASHGYIMETGKVVMDKPAAVLREDEDVREFYLGRHGGEEATSFRDVKHYKRRKRWLS